MATTSPWRAGTIGIPDGSGKFGHLTAVHYAAKVYDEGSEYGINGGRISKLTLMIDGECVYNYDRGEDIPPQNEASEKALAILLYEYDERAKEEHPVGRLYAEWIDHRGDWRLYQLEYPQQTVAYVDDLEEPRSRGYEVVVAYGKKEQA